MANQFSAVKKINPRGVLDDCLEIFVDTYDIYRLNNILAEAGTYTFVVWYCSAANCNITFDVLGTKETVESTTVWTKFIKTVEYDGSNNNIDITQDLDSTIYLYEGYITKGSQDKSWSLAPEDFEQSIDNANSLTIESMTESQQTATMFRWVVKSGTNETNFTLTDRAAELVAEQINLKGLVTFTGLDSEVPSEILGVFAGEPVEGSTTIHGGFIQTNTIKSTHIDTEDLYSSSAFIGAVQATELNANMIKAGEINANLLNLYGLRVLQLDTNIETLAIENTGDVTIRGSVESYNYIAGESGWSIKSNGNAEFNDVIVRGDLINPSGGITATNGDIVQVNAWFGASYEERESAPFIIYSDGSMVATKGTFGGVFTGDIEIGNISIVDPSKYAGSDAIVTIQNGDNGIKQVQLTDTGESTFAQSILITDDFYNPTIQLGQDGHISAIGGLTSGGNTFNSDGINLNGNSIIGDSTSTTILTPIMNIGTYNSDSSMKVWGTTTLEKDTTMNGNLFFGNVVAFSYTDDGFDVNFVENTLTFTVTFESNGGQAIAPIRDVEYGSTITAPSNPVRNGYSFAGWYKDSLLNVAFNFGTDTILSDTILYAKWNVVPAVAPTYTITEPTYDSSTGKWTTPYVINAVASDGGTLSYHWEVDYLEGSNMMVAIEDVFATKTSNNITVAELEQYAYYGYAVLQGTCTITNTKLGTTASTVVSVTVIGRD